MIRRPLHLLDVDERIGPNFEINPNKKYNEN
jgi:hypothetical protein